MAARSKARPLEHWDRGFESKSRHGCLSAFLLVVLSCVGRGLATGLVTRQGSRRYEASISNSVLT
jgi:hypothetical protein